MSVILPLLILQVLPYFAAQFLGAFFAACVTYGVYVGKCYRQLVMVCLPCVRHEDAILSANCGNGTDPKQFVNCTAGIFATYPQGYLSVGNGFFDQVWTVPTFNNNYF